MANESTALEIETDEAKIEKIHERKSLLRDGRKKVKAPSCKVMLGKAVVLCIAGILFILMMIELWGDYGNAISTQTLFKPRLFSMMESCPPGAESTAQLKKQYNELTCSWDINATASTLHCDGDMPTNPMVLPSGTYGHNSLEMGDDHMCLTWEGINVSRCVRLLIYSI